MELFDCHSIEICYSQIIFTLIMYEIEEHLVPLPGVVTNMGSDKLTVLIIEN